MNGSVVLGNVGQAELDVADAITGIFGQTVTGEAGSAEVLVSDVSQTVWDVDEADVAVDGQAGEVGVTLNAETQAVVLETVADASWNARSPVSGLSVTVGAVGAQVGPWDVGQAVGDDREADAVD